MNATSVAAKWNPRFVAYAKSNGLGAEEQLEHDKAACPGGCMTGFVLWISQKRAAFEKASPKSFLLGAIADQAAWDAFLGVRA